MQRSFYASLFAITICSLSCLAQSEKDDLHKQILSWCKNYCAAVETQNVNEVISHYWKSPDFFVYAGGKMHTYDEYVAQVKSVLPQLKKVKLSFDTLYIRQLRPNHVVVAGPFKESFLNPEGKEMSFDIQVTWVLIKQDKKYKLAYATGVYQPLHKEK
jgi:ketosteroid isomerase-like protein